MMELNKKTLRNIFIGVMSCIVLYWLLHATDRVKIVLNVILGILSPFFAGAGVAFIINVPMRFFEKKLSKISKLSVRRLVALIITFLIFLLVLAGVFWLLIPQLISTIESLIPQIYQFVLDAEVFFMNFLESNPELLEWITQNTEIENFNWSQLAQNAISVVGNSVTTILKKMLSAIGSVTDAVVNGVIAIVFAIYCLFQKETLARQGRKLVYAFLPERTADYIVKVFRLSNATFSNFLSGQCLEVCILGAMFAVSMAVFRMPYIPLVSVLIAVTAFIPIVGAFVGCVVGAFLIFVDDPMLAVWFVIMFLIIQQVEGNMIYPKVVGNSIGLSGMWVLFAVAIGGELMGVAGMFLMIPVASVLHTLLREYTNNKLSKMQIDPEKLKEQPPELSSKFKEKRIANKEKRKNRKSFFKK